MVRRASALLAVAVSLAVSASFADESRPPCGEAEPMRDAIGYSPWVRTIRDSSGRERTWRLAQWGELTEAALVRFFSSEENLPEIESTVAFELTQEGRQVRVRRTWRFDGLTLSGELSYDSAIRFREIQLTSERYSLVCGLRIGLPRSAFTAALGPPDIASAPEAEGRVGTGWRLPKGTFGYHLSEVGDHQVFVRTEGEGEDPPVVEVTWHFGADH